MWLIFKYEFNGAKRPFSNIGRVVLVDTGKVRKRNGLDSIIHFVPNPLLTLTSFQFHQIYLQILFGCGLFVHFVPNPSLISFQFHRIYLLVLFGWMWSFCSARFGRCRLDRASYACLLNQNYKLPLKMKNYIILKHEKLTS